MVFGKKRCLTQKCKAEREARAHRTAHDLLAGLGYGETKPAISLLDHAKYCIQRAKHYAEKLQDL